MSTMPFWSMSGVLVTELVIDVPVDVRIMSSPEERV
jgi:hypothetical protein